LGRGMDPQGAPTGNLSQGERAGLPLDLLGVVNAWPTLPAAIRRAVLALVRAGRGEADDR
jgi:hypothetical protein